MDWITDNAEIVILGLAALSAVVWIAYLQLFYLSFKRQRESMIMIQRGAAEDDRARFIVTNLGTEPIYIIAVLAEVTIGGERHVASVTDRDEVAFETLENPLQQTNQGPLKSAEFRDIGCIRDLIARACRRLSLKGEADVDEIEVVIAAAAGHARDLIVARRRFVRPTDDSGARVYAPTSLLSRQVRTRRSRKKVLRQIDATLLN